MKERWQQLLLELGWQGITGAVFLVFGVFMSGLVLSPMQDKLASEIGQIESHKREAINMQSMASASPSLLAKFYSFISTSREPNEILSRIFNLAQTNGLELKLGEYSAVHNTNERITNYRIVLPVNGSYRQIRNFAAMALLEVPTLSLDQINFERSHVMDQNLEAQIVFTLYILPS